MKYATLAFPSSPQAFTYSCPPSLGEGAGGWNISPGDLVSASLRNKSINGIVLAISDDTPKYRTKPVEKLIRREVLTDWQVKTANWMIDYYQAHAGKTFRLFVPDRVWNDRPLKRKTKGIKIIPLPRKEHQLTSAQKKALSAILANANKKASVLLLTGPAGSGKTTISKLIEKKYGFQRIDGDVIQKELFPNESLRMPKDKSKIQKVHDKILARVKNLAENKKNIVLDYLFYGKFLEKYRNDLPEIKIKILLPNKNTALARNAKRDRKTVGEERIERQYREFEKMKDQIETKNYIDSSDQSPEETLAEHFGDLKKSSAFSPKPSAFLLHGITGSGKTEVYLRVILETLKKGQQSILLVPEIALTPQLVGYFAAHIDSEKITVLHSHLAIGMKLAAWERIRAGEVKLVIGSRSALFAPVTNPGVIILDEEHEWTYKNDQTPRYHTRAVAERMAKLTRCKLILGSATPSLESYAAAKTDRIQLLELPERINQVPLPKVKVVDLREELKKENYSLFSENLTEKIRNRLEKKEQTILLLNKRGYSSSLVCRDCGESVHCQHCAVPLTLHRRNGSEQMICHFCGKIGPPPRACPTCRSQRIKALGTGTQKLEEEIATHFPKARVLRADRDTTAQVGSHQRIFDEFRVGKADILVGTQIVAKGLDLPNVTLVGVLLADIGLHLPDFRAAEKTFSLLTQVAGRAGRAEKLGEVVIQTYSPEHPAILAAAQHDYKSFFGTEIKERKELGYPPFSRIVKFAFIDMDEKKAREAAQQFAKKLGQFIIPTKAGIQKHEQKSATCKSGFPVKPSMMDSILTAPALIPKIHNKYHWHVIWRGQNPSQLWEKIELPTGVRVDVDPVSVV